MNLRLLGFTTAGFQPHAARSQGTEFSDQHDRQALQGHGLSRRRVRRRLTHKAWHDTSDTIRKIQAAQYVAAHDGEVCPAKWKPGAKTLAPSLDLVGKI
jgi:hypothetical protein